MDVKQILKYSLAGIALLAVGVAIGRYTLPDKIVEKIVVKEVIKEIEHKDEVKVVTQKPDGTIITETHTVIDKKTEAVKDKSSEKEISTIKNDWFIAVAAKTSLPVKINYGVHISRRIIGPIYIGAVGYTDKSFGISVGLAF